jgi:hypothetical protein
MSKLSATWHKVVEAEILQRSSQVVSVVDGQAYVFGGELRPREPRDNDIHVISLNAGMRVAYCNFCCPTIHFYFSSVPCLWKMLHVSVLHTM